MAEIDNDILDMLTEEERAALEDSDYIDDDEGGDPSDLQTPASAAAEEVVTPLPSDPAPATPAVQAPVDIAALNEQLASFKTQRDELTSSYDDGDLTAEEYRQKLDELDEQKSEVQGKKAIAEDQANRTTAAWNQDVSGYLKEYPGLKADGALQTFDRFVSFADEAFPKLTNAEILAKAHQMLLNEAAGLGLKDIPAIKGKTPQPKPTPPVDPMRVPPMTLKDTSATELSGGNDSPLAALQKLVEEGTSDEIEAAMARLSPEERDLFASTDI